MKQKAPIYLWTGPGWGKSTSALGAAIRCIGHGYKATIIQFMKGRKDKIGEYKIRKKLGRLYEIHQFGSPDWVNLKKPSDKDKRLAEKGFKAAKEAAKKKPFLLILDEINLAISIGLLDERKVIKYLDDINPKVHVYLTGRNATRKLRNRADYVNVIQPIKGPKKLIGEKGIDY